MKLTKFSFVSVLCASMVAIAGPLASAQTSLFSKEAEQKAHTLLKQMTVDEKVGQLNESSGMVIPGLATEKPDDLIAHQSANTNSVETNNKKQRRPQKQRP